MKRAALQLVVLMACWAAPHHAYAWDYLEHAWFTDVACQKAQAMLAERIKVDPSEDLKAKYVALGLFCPVDDTRIYCKDGQKVVRGALNLIRDPSESGDYSITLGDIAALPDHVSRFGPLKNVPNAQDDGLVLRALEWLTGDGTVGGVIESVAEDACETDVADFEGASDQVAESYHQIHDHDGLEPVPRSLLLPGLRTPPAKGPEDPTTLYSFNNPHYLDLVLRNHTHFGELAFGSWVGFHSAALRVSEMSCQDLVPPDPDVMEDLAEESTFADLDWSELGPKYGSTACHVFSERLRSRLEFWLKNAPAAVTDPVRGYVAGITQAQSEAVLVQIVALVFEGSGIHFLQDGLSAGHMRTVRSRESLSEVRYDHNLDNLRGVIANMDTRAGEHFFWAWGDTYLLSKTPTPACSMDWQTLGNTQFPIAEMVTACSIRHQRGLMAASTAASIMDWGTGGPAFDEHAKCGELDTIEGWICRTLPMRAAIVSGANTPPHRTVALQYGTMPLAPPDYSYESLSVRVGLEIPEKITQLGVKVSFLEQLDHPGHWLTSYRFGLHTTLGDAKNNQWVLDGSYQFHYRVSARGMIEAGPFLFGGLRDIGSPSFFAGVGPSIGVAFLPEGWLNMPLEITVTYRLPLVMFSSQNGFFHDELIDGHWLQFGVGLAYSH
jgi:hypothetical protein